MENIKQNLKRRDGLEAFYIKMVLMMKVCNTFYYIIKNSLGDMMYMGSSFNANF